MSELADQAVAVARPLSTSATSYSPTHLQAAQVMAVVDVADAIREVAEALRALQPETRRNHQ